MGNSLTIERLASNPILAYSISIPTPLSFVSGDFELTEYEESALPAIMGKITGISVERVVPKFKMGRVYSLDITPRTIADPIIVFSPIGDLSDYYRIWSSIVRNGVGMFVNKRIKEYTKAISKFCLTAEDSGLGLNRHEIIFATIEMLKFQNDVILNPNWR